jgi:hypothetical protein
LKEIDMASKLVPLTPVQVEWCKRKVIETLIEKHSGDAIELFDQLAGATVYDDAEKVEETFDVELILPETGAILTSSDIQHAANNARWMFGVLIETSYASQAKGITS